MTLDTPAALDTGLEQTLELRWARYAPRLTRNLQVLYGDGYPELMERLREIVARSLRERPADLRRLDEERLLRPDWLQLPEMIGYVCYADRFAGNLRGVADKVDYLAELGVRYLHVM